MCQIWCTDLWTEQKRAVPYGRDGLGWESPYCLLSLFPKGGRRGSSVSIRRDCPREPPLELCEGSHPPIRGHCS